MLHHQLLTVFRLIYATTPLSRCAFFLNIQVPLISDDPYVQHLDPNGPIAQPNITPLKIKTMWEGAVAKASQPYHNWKGESGNHEPDASKFCTGG